MNTNGIRTARANRFLWMIISLQLCCWSCNTRIEGCLDAQAYNFNFDAELACSGCCTYPTIGLTLSQKWEERNFTNTDTLYDQFNQPYKIQDLKYFLASWTWKDADGVVYTVDSARADCGNEVLVYAPDNIIIDTRQFSYTMGNIRNSPEMINLNFITGLSQDFSCLDPEDPAVPDNITKDSPLWNPATSSLSAIRMVLQLQPDTMLFDTLFVDLQQPFDLPYNETFLKGTDTQLELTVDYNLWFSEVDVNDLSSFGHSVRKHLPGSIFPTP